MLPVDYKSKELNLYSNNGVGHLKFQDGKGSNKAPGFGPTAEYIFAKYTDSATSAMQWPVVIPELHTIDNSTGSVMGVSYWIGDAKQKLADETKERKSEDAHLSAQLSAVAGSLSAESKARADAVADEASARTAGDAKAESDLAAESAARQQADNGNWATILIVENDSKNRDAAIEVKLGIEATRASGAEVLIQSNLDAEMVVRSDEIQRLDDRIDFLTHNVDGAAIDSLSEIVSQFSANGQTYANRLSYLEGIVAALVNRSQ